MAKNDNLKEFLIDVADAIREKAGESSLINPQDFSSKIKSIGWTGHADAEGLRAIGWTDEDIAYYQQNGVNWNEEDDEYHKVTDDNKALYGVLTANNISTYKNRIVYLPKIDTSGKNSTSSMFSDCKSLIAVPELDIRNATTAQKMFYNCYSLVSVVLKSERLLTNTNNMFYNCCSLTSFYISETRYITDMSYMFYNCYSLASISDFRAEQVTTTARMFYNCYSLSSIPHINAQMVTNMSYMFYNCYSLSVIPYLYVFKNTAATSMFANCNSLTHINIYGVTLAYDLSKANLLSKKSLLCLINNEAATSAITIKLSSYAYTRLANDTDIVAALAAHPNISISN
jgi:hypothetical protein